MDYKLLQLTNNSVGSVAVGSNMPLGIVTGRVNCPYYNMGSIYYTTSSNDTIVIGSRGHYKVDYNGSLTLATGTFTLSLSINGTSIYTISQTITDAGTYIVNLPYEFRVKDTVPTNVQFILGGTAVSGGTSNIIVEKIS